MKTKMRVKIKGAFDGKISNILCHNLNEFCGQKWTKAEILKILNSSKKCYLNEIGRKYMVDKSEVNYVSAYYLLVSHKLFFTKTGEQLFVWLYRVKIDEPFGRINIGLDEDFDYSVVKNYFTKTKKTPYNECLF